MGSWTENGALNVHSHGSVPGPGFEYVSSREEVEKMHGRGGILWVHDTGLSFNIGRVSNVDGKTKTRLVSVSKVSKVLEICKQPRSHEKAYSSRVGQCKVYLAPVLDLMADSGCSPTTSSWRNRPTLLSRVSPGYDIQQKKKKKKSR